MKALHGGVYQVKTPPLLTPPPAPALYLSSANAGWEGLQVQAFHQPMAHDQWLMESAPDLGLVLFFEGALRLEWLCPNHAWSTQDVYHGEMTLCLRWEGPHTLRWKALSGGPMQTLHLQVSRQLLMRTAEELVGGDPAHLSWVKRIGFRDPLLTQLGIALRGELEQEAPAGRLYAQTAAQLLAAHLVRHYSSLGGKIKDPCDKKSTQKLTQPQLQRVVDCIEAHGAEQLSLECLAYQTHYSPYHFARLFHQTTGESPHQFVLRSRIARAQHLLEATTLPLARIAGDCGFADQSYFTRVFKRALGVTPRAYRQDRCI